MCGRVIRTSPGEALRQIFDLVAGPDGLRARYNLAPSEPIPVIRRPRHLELLRWGLKMPDARMAGINARVESLTKPIYRDKVRDNRCLVVVDGFYEWRSLGGAKFPQLRRLARPEREGRSLDPCASDGGWLDLLPGEPRREQRPKRRPQAHRARERSGS